MSLPFKGIFLAVGMLSAGVAPASAQGVGLLLHLINQCRADAADFCADVRPGEGRIAACLYSHLQDLRPDCRHAVRAGLAIKACAFDAREYCQGVLPGDGRIAACLAGVRDRLSPGCGNVIAFWTGDGRRWHDDDGERELLK